MHLRHTFLPRRARRRPLRMRVPLHRLRRMGGRVARRMRHVMRSDASRTAHAPSHLRRASEWWRAGVPTIARLRRRF